MENPLQILRDALELHGLTWDETIQVMAGISHPEAILDMADWVVDHPRATVEGMYEQGNLLIKKYQIQEK